MMYFPFQVVESQVPAQKKTGSCVCYWLLKICIFLFTFKRTMYILTKSRPAINTLKEKQYFVKHFPIEETCSLISCADDRNIKIAVVQSLFLFALYPSWERAGCPNDRSSSKSLSHVTNGRNVPTTNLRIDEWKIIVEIIIISRLLYWQIKGRGLQSYNFVPGMLAY